MSSEKQKLHTICFVLVFILLCVIYFHEQLFLGPSFMHAWAQGDRYSLAINFYDNGMNFFLPSTSNLTSKNGITGVEFPIQAYLAAALGHIFGRDNISICYKLITIFISGMGLYALFLTVYERTRDVIFSLLTPLLVFCSPVFIFYTCNYLPDTAGASFAFMSFYYVADHLDTGTKKSYYTALVFLMIGTLIKTSVGIYLLGYMGVTFLYRTFGRERISLLNNIRISSLSALFLLPVIANYKYSTWLTEKYQAYIFMSKPMPFEDWKMFTDYVTIMFKERWMYDYLSLPTYFIGIALFVTAIFLMRKSFNGKKHMFLISVFLIGTICMFYLMGAQLWVHDYYFIAIVMPLVAYTLVISVSYIYQKGIAVSAIRVIFVAALTISIFIGHNQFKKRFDDSTDLYRWSLDGARILDELGISRKEPIMLVREYASNLPLSYFDRRGYNFYFEGWDYELANMIGDLERLQVQVIVLRAETEQKMKERFPDNFDRFTHLITKGELAVYRYNGN